jgi:hypothetical protein
VSHDKYLLDACADRRGELERMLVTAKEEWLSLPANAMARGKDNRRGPAVKN